MVVGAGRSKSRKLRSRGRRSGGLQVGEAVRGGELEVTRGAVGAVSSARKTATRVTSRVCGQAIDDGVEQRRGDRSGS